MTMQRGRFVLGIVAGLVFALAIVASTNYSTVLAPAQPVAYNGAEGNAVATSTVSSAASATTTATFTSTSVVTSTTTTGASAPAPPVPAYSTTTTNTQAAGLSNLTAATSSTTSSSSTPQQSLTGATSPTQTTAALPKDLLSNVFGVFSPSSVPRGATTASPSSVSSFAGQPAQSALLLLPVLVAVLLGLLLYRAAAPRD